jgi:prepilin-type N-terminal cleavage/methylation domain-containing protein/prepilin-type processing-associated H-X9-DG protein
MKHRAPISPVRAFTLIELLVVVIIIAVLAALIFPALSQAKERGYATKSSQNLRQLTAANMAYAAEQGFYAPADNKQNTRRWCAGMNTGSSEFDPTKGYLSPYLGKDGAVLACPLFTKMLRGAQSFESGTGGYGYNAAYIGGLPGPIDNNSYNADGSRRSAVPASVLHPSTTLMFATTAYASGESVQEYPYAEPPFWADRTGAPTGGRASPSVHFRFQGKAIIGWCDGHVSFEAPTPREAGDNPHGGDATAQSLGWPGPDEDNGWWNPQREE